MSGTGCKVCRGTSWLKLPNGENIPCPGDTSAPEQAPEGLTGFISSLAVTPEGREAHYADQYALLRSFDDLDSAGARQEALAVARQDFRSWVQHAAFADEDDSTRGRYWEGATRYGTTPEGYAALQRIAENPESTPALRAAAGAMLLEVGRYKEQIRGGWVVAPDEEDTAEEARFSAVIAEGSQVDWECRGNLSPGTTVLGSSVRESTRTTGSVLIQGSTVDSGTLESCVVEQSTVYSATIKDSRLSGARVAEKPYWRTPYEMERQPTVVERSTLGPGSEVSGASITDSTVHGTVIGTGAGKAGLVDSREIMRYRETFSTFLSTDVTSEQARTQIGVNAEDATYSRVAHSAVSGGSAIRNTHLSYCTVKDGVDADFAVIEKSTLEGTACIRGEYIHETPLMPRYTTLREIIVRDRRAKVSNVRLTREFIGPAAEVTRQGHVKSVVKDGVVVTKYRTRFRSGLRQAVWAYTTTKVDPSTGSLKREFVGYGGGDAAPEVRRLALLF